MNVEDLPVFKQLVISAPALTLSDPATNPVDLPYFKLRLSCTNANPISSLQLILYITGSNPPTSELTLRSTVNSKLFYASVLPLSAYSPKVEWSVDLLAGYHAELYVSCGPVSSNVIKVFKH